MVEITDVSKVRQRTWNWLGQLLRREGKIDCLTASGWTPEEQEGDRRPLGEGLLGSRETRQGGKAYVFY